MSHRGQNTNNNTLQVWNGTRWVPVNNFQLADSGANSVLTASGNLTTNATAGTYTVNGQAVTIQTTVGSMVLTSNAGWSATSATLMSLTSTGGNITRDATSGSITDTAQAITLQTTVGSLQLTAGGTGSVGITGATNITLTATAGNNNRSATSGSITDTAQAITLQTTVGSLQLTAGGTGSVGITGGTAVNVTANAGNGDFNVTARNTILSGNLIVNGTMTTVDTQTTLIKDPYINLGQGNTVAGARPAGLVVDYLPVAPLATAVSGAFTATTISVAGLGAVAGNYVMVTGCAIEENNGLFQVLTYVDPLLTIATGTADPWVQNSLSAGAASGTVTKMTISVNRVGTDGIWEYASGASNPLTFTDFGVGTVTSITESTDNIIVVTNPSGPVVDLSTPNLRVTASSGVAFGGGTPTNPGFTASGVFIGLNAGGAIAGGGSNIAIGVGAMNAASTGSTNIAIGSAAQSSVITGSSNVAIGNAANIGAGAGAANIVIGNGATANAGFDNTIGLGTSVATLGSDQSIINRRFGSNSEQGYFQLNATVDGIGYNGSGSGVASVNGTKAGKISAQVAKWGVYATTADLAVNPLQTIDNTVLAGGASVGFFTGTATPVGAVTGNPGDVYFRSDAGASSAIYLHTGAAADNTSWSALTTGAAAKNEIVVNASADPAPSAATLQANYITYACNVNAGAFTVTLPSGCANGTKVRVKDRFNGGTQAGTNNITIAASGGETIDGTASQFIATNFGSMTFIKGAGTDWLVV